MQIVDLYSDSNFLSLNLFESLLTKNCFINIVTNDVKGWTEKTGLVSNRSRFSIVSQNKFVNPGSTYSIIVSGFLGGEPYEFINNIFKKFDLSKSKTLILLPFEKYSFEKNSELKVPDNIGIVYFGDLFGPRMDLSSDLFAVQLINGIVYKRTMTFGIGESVYPVFIGDATKTLVKWLFSFGPYGKELLYLGPQLSGSDFWKANDKFVPDVKIIYDEKIFVRKIPKGLEIKISPTDTRLIFTETYKWISVHPPSVKPRLILPKIKKSLKPKRKYPKYLKPLIFSILAVTLLPVVLLSICSGLFYFSYRQFLSGRDDSSTNLLLISKTFSVVSKEESRVLAIIPIIGKVYKETLFISGAFERFSDIGVTAIPVFRSASTLTEKVLGNEVYDPSVESQRMEASLEDLYREISFLQADTNSGVDDNLTSAKFLDSKINLEKYKNLSLQGKTLFENLPGVLGKDQPKTYLLLFENNTELRPTGGFIGSFGILTFDSGRIADLTINDVYSADGQLNGHVEPPTPIKDYLGEANWWLRDSNWDPDFPTSAKRAEWFLDKEMGRSVDGVMSIDLEPVKNILKYTGPVFLPDYNMEITSDNLYEKTQAEVQNNFFPGSRKKASFLTALSRSLLSVVSKLNPGQKMGILKTFYSGLDERHVQVFIHNDDLQNAVSQLSWDGGVATPSCGEACYPDFTGDVEANLGVNKSNYFIERSQNLEVRISSGTIERTLTISLKNNSNPALGLAAKYKTYTRILVPSDSEVESVTLVNGNSRQQISPDVSVVKNRKEVGFLMEVIGGQTGQVEVKWTTIIPAGSIYAKYGLYFRKQAGVGVDPFTLTINGRKIYNSSLVADYTGRFTLK